VEQNPIDIGVWGHRAALPREPHGETEGGVRREVTPQPRNSPLRSAGGVRREKGTGVFSGEGKGEGKGDGSLFQGILRAPTAR